MKLDKSLSNPFDTPLNTLNSDALSKVHTKLATTGVKPTKNKDVLSWYKIREVYEELFCIVCDENKIDAKINPDKKTDKKAPDLIMFGDLSDLKPKATPFYLSEKYGVTPEKCITFNSKDYRRYAKKYPDINIYYWRGWEASTGYGKKVEAVKGVWWLPFKEIDTLIKNGAREHSYRSRHNGNTYDQSSYVLDSQNFKQLLI